MNDQIPVTDESPPITIERVQTLLGSLGGRLPLLTELQRAIHVVHQVADEVTESASQADAGSFSRAAAQLDEVTRPVAQALAWTAAWGQRGVHEPVLRSALQRLANIASQHTGNEVWLTLRSWPASLSLAAIGIAAVDAQREDALGHVLSGVIVRQPNKNEPAAVGLWPTAAIDQDTARQWLGIRRRMPVDDLVFERLTEWLTPNLIDSVAQANDCFDRYQFLTGLVHFDESSRRRRVGWAPLGRFLVRHQDGWVVPDTVAEEIERQGISWPLLSGGLFGSDPTRAKTALDGYRQLIERER